MRIMICHKKMLHLKKTPFRSSITNINYILIDNAEDLDVVMPMYNLLEYRDAYSMTSGSLSNYYTDEIYDEDDDNSEGKSFKYKREIIGKTEVRHAQGENERDNDRSPRDPVPPLRSWSTFAHVTYFI